MEYVFWQVLQLVVIQLPVNKWRQLAYWTSIQLLYQSKRIIIFINTFNQLEMFWKEPIKSNSKSRSSFADVCKNIHLWFLQLHPTYRDPDKLVWFSFYRLRLICDKTG